MNENEKIQLQRVSALAKLKDIRPTEMSAAVLSSMAGDGSEIKLGLKTSWRLESMEQGFSVAVRFDLETREEGQEEAYARFRYSVAALYEMPESEVEYSDEDLQVYARYNSLIHLWPYMRAFVQNACGQLMIPPVVVPVYRVPNGPRANWKPAGDLES